jgi:DNA invertase Pin-like site-specific DNA recombinase
MYDFYDYKNFSPDEILIYLRKSRTDDPLLSVEEVLAKHESILDEWADRNLNASIPERNRFKEVVSGETISDRPEFQKILKLIESPKIKAILTVEVQRLSRGDLEDAGRLIKLLRYTNTLVITPTKTFDLINEYDRDIFERELKRGNEFLEYQKKIMNRGRLLSVSQGNFIGNVAPYGYDKIVIYEGKKKCHSLAINEEQAEVVRMIFDMYVNKDIGYYNICKHLDSIGIAPPKGKYWSPHAMRDMLANVHYLGKVKWNWRKTITIVEDSQIIQTRPKAKMGEYLVYEGKHPAIISEELFNAAQEKQGRNHRTKSTTKVRNPLAGLVQCRCGRAMSLRTYKNPDGTERNAPRLLCDGQTNCNTASCLYSEVMDAVIEILNQKLADYAVKVNENNDDSIREHEKLIKSLEKKLSTLQAKELAQWEAQSDPDPAKRMPQHIFQQLNAKLLKEKEDVDIALRNAYATVPAKIDYEQKVVTLQDTLNALADESVSAAEKNKFLKLCIERIEYHRERPERIKSTEKRTKKNGRVNGKSLKPHPLNVGANWTYTPIELEVKLKV